MFRRSKVTTPKKPKPPLVELRESVRSLKKLISQTKEQLKLKSSRRGKRTKGDARFIELRRSTEESFVELIRRISELAVLGEQKAAAITLGDDKPSGDNGNGRGDRSADNIQANVHDNAVFDYFCEANVVSIIVNIATGAAFQVSEYEDVLNLSDSLEFANINGLHSDDADGADSSDETEADIYTSNPSIDMRASKTASSNTYSSPVLLPPISIAIQAIQSMSILVQNVKMTTSLYFILSNNKVNDLINLPLQLYFNAEKNRKEEAAYLGNDLAREDDTLRSQSTWTSDISELTNIFVALLKSLAMKMNPETLQFYLSYPTGQHDPNASMSSSSSTSPRKQQNTDFPNMQFPLYERALQFCNNDDPFVRITAMNLCLNTLRLAADGGPQPDQDLNGDLRKSNEWIEFDDRPEQRKNPDSVSRLPFRERLAISHYMCDPLRVQKLCAGIFNKLATLCGKVEEAIRTMERIDRGISACFVSIDNQRKSVKNANRKSGRSEQKAKIGEEKKRIEVLQSERIKVVKHFLGDIISDFQDELFLLEDVLTVGLVPLNEQIIEMMFPTVIYPLVLTPLHNFIRQNMRPVYDDDISEPNPFTSLSKHMSRPVSRGTPSATAEGDSSLAKSALFVIASIYHFISHEQLLHLLLTALLHPLAPDISTAKTITQRIPNVVYQDENKCLHIKTDRLQESVGLGIYEFGCSDETHFQEDFVDEGDSRHDCIFVFSPILSDIFEWSTGLSSKSPPENLSPNRYRRTLLSCLSGTDGMAELQSLAVYAIDAIVSTVGKSVLNSIIFGTHIHEEIEFRSPSPDVTDGNESIASDATSAFSASVASSTFSISASKHMIEFIACMCVGVSAASISYDGLWTLKYNPVAAHAIYCATMIDSHVKETATRFIRHRRRQSAKFVFKTPARLKKYANSEEKDIDDDLKMDRVFFEGFCEGDKFVVESTVRKQGASGESLWDGPGFIPVAKDGSIQDLAKQICEDISAKHIIGHDCEEAAYRCGANSALSHVKLDAFALLLKDKVNTSSLKNQQGYIGVAAFARCNKRSIESRKNGDRMLVSPLSEKMNSLLFNEEVSSTANSSGTVPKPGDVVKLVGRKPFPCVCEVNEDSEMLITDGGASVISEGVKWQSLYLVMFNKHMILTEPVKGDSGGYGRVVSCCPLSCLMAVSHDSPDIGMQSTARRLLLTHYSPERQPPGLFVAENKADADCQNDEVIINRSCLDIWFEDSNSAAKAHKSLCSRIFKARIERGKEIRESLPR